MLKGSGRQTREFREQQLTDAIGDVDEGALLGKGLEVTKKRGRVI